MRNPLNNSICTSKTAYYVLRYVNVNATRARTTFLGCGPGFDNILKAIHRVNFGHQLSNVVHKNCMFFIFWKRYLFFKLGAKRCKHWPKFVKLFGAHFIQKNLRNISLNTTISYKSILWLFKLQCFLFR